MNEELEGITEAIWIGGPYDGEPIGVPDGTMSVTMVTTVYAGTNEEDAIVEQVHVVPLQHTPNGPRVMWYDAIRKEQR